MAYTKRDIINMAFEEIGLAGYVFDLQPQQLEGALRRLDGIVGSWSTRGVRTSYPLPGSTGDSDLDQDSGFDVDQAYAASLNLAISIAPGYGKTVSPDTKINARKAYTDLVRLAMRPVEMQINNSAIPAGAGSKSWRDFGGPFLAKPVHKTPLADVSNFNFDFGDLIAGDTYNGVEFELKLESGSPVVLTDAKIAATFRYGAVDGSLALAMTNGSGLTVTDAANGEFSLDAFVVPAAPGIYYGDIEVTFPDGTRRTYITSVMRVQQQVTNG